MTEVLKLGNIVDDGGDGDLNDEYIKKLEYIVDYYHNSIDTDVKKLDEVINKIKRKKEVYEINSKEPILKNNINRFTTFPIRYADLWELYKIQEKASWTAEELDYSSDLNDYKKLNDGERFVIEHVLAFFAGSDGIVMENVSSNFSTDVQIPEARAFYAEQNKIEQVHSTTYSLLIDTYVPDPKRKDELFRAIETIPCVKKKADWAIKWMNQDTSTFAERLVAFSVVEGVFFSGSFCVIFWLKSRGIMISGLGKSNELIARDENIHCKFAITLYKHIENKLSKERIHEIFKEAVEIESNFITESIPCKLLGMNSSSMIRYIKFVANYWMTQLKTNKGKNCPPAYNVTNPFSFMDMNGFDAKNNFFEGVTTEYRKKPDASSSSFSNIYNEDF